LLPGALLGACPSALLEAVARPKEVRSYVGEYQLGKQNQVQRWISPRDAVVASRLVEKISSPATMGKQPITFRFCYVPFHPIEQGPEQQDKQFLADVRNAKKVYEEISGRDRRHSSILVGSQKANNVVELFVADLYEVRPFQRPPENSRIPFYLASRPRDRAFESCFGGHGAPPRHTGETVPGVYYRAPDAQGPWELIEWKEDQQDGGIVVTAHDPGTNVTELVIFGLSGRGTAAVGQEVAERPDLFWHSREKGEDRSSRAVRIYVCEIKLRGEPADETYEEVGLESFRVVQEYAI
jgi:hypothetical protein